VRRFWPLIPPIKMGLIWAIDSVIPF
jgi:hypothetical protein